MITRRYLTALGLSIFLSLPFASAVALEPAEAGALYQHAFESLDLNLNEQERAILVGEQEGKISDETRGRIREGLQTLARAASAETVDWQREENPNELFPIFKHVGPARDAARLGVWHAKEVGVEDPNEALNALQSVLSLSRHLNEDGMLIELLTSIAIEKSLTRRFRIWPDNGAGKTGNDSSK